MNFAVVKLGGKQHLVTPNQKLTVEGNLGQEGESLTLNEILLLNLNDKLQIGTPIVNKTEVKAKRGLFLLCLC